MIQAYDITDKLHSVAWLNCCLQTQMLFRPSHASKAFFTSSIEVCCLYSEVRPTTTVQTWSVVPQASQLNLHDQDSAPFAQITNCRTTLLQLEDIWTFKQQSSNLCPLWEVQWAEQAAKEVESKQDAEELQWNKLAAHSLERDIVQSSARSKCIHYTGAIESSMCVTELADDISRIVRVLSDFEGVQLNIWTHQAHTVHSFSCELVRDWQQAVLWDLAHGSTEKLQVRCLGLAQGNTMQAICPQSFSSHMVYSSGSWYSSQLVMANNSASASVGCCGSRVALCAAAQMSATKTIANLDQHHEMFAAQDQLARHYLRQEMNTTSAAAVRHKHHLQLWQRWYPIAKLKHATDVQQTTHLELISKYPQLRPTLLLLHRYAAIQFYSFVSQCAQTYVSRCVWYRSGKGLSAVLQGQLDPLELLFPGGNMETAEEVYSVYGQLHLVQAAVQAVLNEHSWKQERVRILEVGAGTGATTASLLPIIPVGTTDYWFTDLSEGFLKVAYRRWSTKDYPFVRYGILDLNADPVVQGFAPHSFCAVVAVCPPSLPVQASTTYDLSYCVQVNVLHATRDLRISLANIHRLLRPGGIVIVGESTATEHSAFHDVAFGLNETYWLFDDGRDYALQTREQWINWFHSTGFATVDGSVQPEHFTMDSTVFVAHTQWPLHISRHPCLLAPKDFTNGAFLVTGGLSGFGLAASRWLVDTQCVGSLVLALNSNHHAATGRPDTLVDSSVQTQTLCCNLSQVDQLSSLLYHSVAGESLRGVISAHAMTQNSVDNQSISTSGFHADVHQSNSVMNLYKCTQHHNLLCFMVFSSSPTQISVLDAFAERHRGLGQRTLQVKWPTVSAEVMAQSSMTNRAGGYTLFGPSNLMHLLVQATGTLSAIPAHSLNLGPNYAMHTRPSSIQQQQPDGKQGQRQEYDVDAIAAFIATQVRQFASVQPDESLLDAGLDSLMSMDLQAQLSSEFGVRVDSLVLYPTISLIAEHVHSKLASNLTADRQAVKYDTLQFECLQLQPDASVRIFCSPPLGCGRSQFEHWRAMQGVEIWMLGDSTHGDWLHLIATLCDGVAGVCQDSKPFILLGNSFGSLVAFEVALKLEAQYGLVPIRLFVSQCGSPVRHRAVYMPPFTSIDLSPAFDQDLFDVFRLEAIESGILPPLDYNMLMLPDPAIWKGVQLFLSYKWSLKCTSSPIVVLFADHDILFHDPHSLQPWHQCTSAGFNILHINGTHSWHMSKISPWLEQRITSPVHQPPHQRLCEVYILESSYHGTPAFYTRNLGSAAGGLLIYVEGFMMAQLWSMPRHWEPVEAAAVSLGGYYGKYDHDMDSNIVKHSVQNCTNPNDRGDMWCRYAEFHEDNRLTLTVAPKTENHGKYEQQFVLNWKGAVPVELGKGWDQLSGVWNRNPSETGMIAFTSSGHLVLQLYDCDRADLSDGDFRRSPIEDVDAAWNSCLCVVAKLVTLKDNRLQLKMIEASRAAFGWTRDCSFELQFQLDNGAIFCQLSLFLPDNSVIKFWRGSDGNKSSSPSCLEASSNMTTSEDELQSSNDEIQPGFDEPSAENHKNSSAPTTAPKDDSRHSGIVSVGSVDELVELMDGTNGVRAVGAGWSWSPALVAKPGCTNIKLEGSFATATFDAETSTSVVGAGLTICLWMSMITSMGLDLEWAPKGYCYSSFDSQTFGGFIATNVHHSWTPTSYHDVLAARVMVFEGKIPTVVSCSTSRNEDLFGSLFGGAGFTGIILSLTLKLRPATYWTRHVHVQRMPTLMSSYIHRVAEQGTFVSVDWGHAEVCVMTVRVSEALECDDSMQPSSSFDFGLLHKIGGLRYLRTVQKQLVEHVLPAADYYTASSWMVDRTSFGPPLSADTLILTEQTDVTMFLDVEHLDLVVEIISTIVADFKDQNYAANESNSLTIRYVPQGGGCFASNVASDVIGVECVGIGSMAKQRALAIASQMMTFFEAQGIHVHLHPGKTFPGHHPCFHQVLSPQTRKDINLLLEKYDSTGFFDSGELSLRDLFDLSQE